VTSLGQMNEGMKRLATAISGAALAATLATMPANAQESSSTYSSTPAPASTTSNTTTSRGSADGADNVGEPTRAGRLRASAELTGTYTDNAWYQSSSGSRKSAVGGLLKPDIAYTIASPRISFTGGVSGALAVFNLPGTVDDYADVSGRAGIAWTPAAHHRLGYDASVSKGHDPFGLDRTAGAATASRSLDKWVLENYALNYVYGTPAAAYTIETLAGVSNKTYKTNRDSGTQFLDNDIEWGQATVFFNYSPKTQALVDLRASHIHFGEEFPQTPSRSGDDYRAHVGARWVATAKTSGDVRVGYAVRQFQASQRSAFHALDWQVSGSWAPVIRTLFVLQTGRRSLESYDNLTAFIDVRYADLSWKEEWTSRFSTRASVGYSYADFVGTSRTDRGINASLAGAYRLSRWLAAIAGYNFDRRTSTLKGFFEYDKSTAYFGFRADY
jgi:hypothetical protein